MMRQIQVRERSIQAARPILLIQYYLNTLLELNVGKIGPGTGPGLTRKTGLGQWMSGHDQLVTEK